jgi:hypothetical protein
MFEKKNDELLHDHNHDLIDQRGTVAPASISDQE